MAYCSILAAYVANERQRAQDGSVSAAALAAGCAGEVQSADADVADVTPAAARALGAAPGGEPAHAASQLPAAAASPVPADSMSERPTTPELAERRLTVVRPPSNASLVRTARTAR